VDAAGICLPQSRRRQRYTEPNIGARMHRLQEKQRFVMMALTTQIQFARPRSLWTMQQDAHQRRLAPASIQLRPR